MAKYSDVKAFHHKFGMLSFDKPGHITLRKAKERVACMEEELGEFIEAMYRNDLVGMADALIDLVFFAQGTADMMGLPWDWLWADVARANMAKERGLTKRGHLVDVAKPVGWVGPQTLQILKQAGYNPEIDSKEENHRDDEFYVKKSNDL